MLLVPEEDMAGKDHIALLVTDKITLCLEMTRYF